MSKENSHIITDVVSDPNEYFLSPTKGGALKVTIPDELNDDLSAYASGYNTSKSEVVRNSLSNYMGNDPRWVHKQYFLNQESLESLLNTSNLVLVLFKLHVCQKTYLEMRLGTQLSF